MRATLRHSNYEAIADGLGAKGLKVEYTSEIKDVLSQAKTLATSGVRVLVNALMDRIECREGSISL